jgi:excisionase family DNA binding protein
MTEASEILTKDEVAALLRLRPSTVDDMARRGDLPSIRLGRHRRYLRSDIEEFIQRLRVA